MDVALEKLIARTEGARRRRRISQVKGQSKGGGPAGAPPAFFVVHELDSAAARPALFAVRALPAFRSSLGKEREHHGTNTERHRQCGQRRALEQAASAAVFAAGHRHLLYHPHPLYSGAGLCRRDAAGLRRLFAQRRKGRQARHELLSGADHRHCGPGGHRQHHRLRHRPLLGRAGRHLLDVGVGLLRDVHHLRRGGAGPAVQDQRRRRPDHRRPHLLYPRRL